MTDTLLDYDPNDSGEVARLPGEYRTRIDAAALHSDETGENTQNLGRYAIHASVVGAIPRKVIELDDTVTFHIPQTIGVVADTQTLTLLGSLTATPDGELRPAAPGPKPGPLPPNPPPAPKPGYVGRHRLSWGGRARRLLAGMGVVGLTLGAIWAGLILAAVAVFL
jgi:hypothetical protein